MMSRKKTPGNRTRSAVSLAEFIVCTIVKSWPWCVLRRRAIVTRFWNAVSSPPYHNYSNVALLSSPRHRRIHAFLFFCPHETSHAHCRLLFVITRTTKIFTSSSWLLLLKLWNKNSRVISWPKKRNILLLGRRSTCAMTPMKTWSTWTTRIWPTPREVRKAFFPEI